MSFESHFNKYWDNEFKNFILQYKDKEWNSNLGYINPNISWELFNDEELNKNGIFGEESIFNLYIQGYSNLWFYLILYSKVSIGKILELYNTHQFWLDYEVMWKLLSRHNDITMDYVLKNNTYNWNYEELSRHPNITLHDIENNIHLPWDFDQMSHNPNINYNFVKKYNYKKWNYKGLSDNKGIYWDDILYNLEQKWNWDRVTRNINITLNIIDKYPHYPWKYDSLFLNKTIRKELLDMKLDFNEMKKKYIINKSLICALGDYFDTTTENTPRDCKLYLFSYDTNLTMDIIKSTNLNWDFNELCCNKNITMNIVKENPQYDWNIYYLSTNSSITFDDINNNLDLDWSWKNISQNEFTKQKEICKLEFAIIWFAVKKIENAFFLVYYNPQYKICRKRILKKHKLVK